MRGFRMSPFYPFERAVLHTLLGPHLAAAEVERMLDASSLVSFEHKEAGYFLTTCHPPVPADGLTCFQPTVIGSAGDVLCGFVAYLGATKLTLECHTWGPAGVPEDFRELDVQIEVKNG